MDTALDQRLVGLGIALGVGFIVGLEREWAEDKPLGVRSFALISALGGLSVLMLDQIGGWPVAAGLLALGLILAARVYGRDVLGLTTMLASLVVFMVGAAAVAGFWLEAIVLGGTVTLLLHWKDSLHAWVERLGREDFGIIARFVLIALVILPVLPNQTYGPYQVFNPFKAWLLVVLIVAINLTGFVAFRLVGARSGAWVAGLVGGLISSTATTVSYAAMTRRQGRLGAVAVLVILVASTVVYARIIVELLAVAPALVPSILGPGLALSAALLGLSGVVYFKLRDRSHTGPPPRENPARIRTALTFSAFFVVILFAVAAARDYLGEDALYGVAFLSGLTDVDALTLSVGQLFARGDVGAGVAWRAIFLASLSNLLFKCVAAGVLGSSELRRWMVATGAPALGTGALLLWLWP